MSETASDEQGAVMTVLGIRVPDELRNRIREAAKLEERTESSFARFYLGRAAEQVLAEQEVVTGQ